MRRNGVYTVDRIWDRTIDSSFELLHMKNTSPCVRSSIRVFLSPRAALSAPVFI